MIGEEEKQGVVIDLRRPSIINTIRLLLWDKDHRSYSYVIEFSLDNQNWTQIIDYSKYFCRSWQRIHFPPKVVRLVPGPSYLTAGKFLNAVFKVSFFAYFIDTSGCLAHTIQSIATFILLHFSVFTYQTRYLSEMKLWVCFIV